MNTSLLTPTLIAVFSLAIAPNLFALCDEPQAATELAGANNEIDAYQDTKGMYADEYGDRVDQVPEDAEGQCQEDAVDSMDSALQEMDQFINDLSDPISDMEDDRDEIQDWYDLEQYNKACGIWNATGSNSWQTFENDFEGITFIILDYIEAFDDALEDYDEC